MNSESALERAETSRPSKFVFHKILRRDVLLASRKFVWSIKPCNFAAHTNFSRKVVFLRLSVYLLVVLPRPYEGFDNIATRWNSDATRGARGTHDEDEKESKLEKLVGLGNFVIFFSIFRRFSQCPMRVLSPMIYEYWHNLGTRCICFLTMKGTPFLFYQYL